MSKVKLDDGRTVIADDDYLRGVVISNRPHGALCPALLGIGGSDGEQGHDAVPRVRQLRLGHLRQGELLADENDRLDSTLEVFVCLCLPDEKHISLRKLVLRSERVRTHYRPESLVDAIRYDSNAVRAERELSQNVSLYVLGHRDYLGRSV